MSHESFRDRLNTLAGTTSQDPGGFLEGLSPIHLDWHMAPPGYGFLLFHNRVVRLFKAIVAPAVEPEIVPYTLDDLEAMGIERFEPDLSEVDALAEMAAFSDALESWHNTAHGAIGAATNTPMHDARQNVFFRPFWQFHFFIDDLFGVVLGQYGERAHPGQFVTLSAVAAHIEARHHGWVPRI
jgi:hypothetical protein